MTSSAAKPILELREVKVHFPVKHGLFANSAQTIKAVDGVSLTINAGQTVAIVGESGCGKTTTGNAILGLAPVTAGSIHFDGQDLGSLSAEARRQIWRDVQVVFQDPVAALNPRRTIAQSIAEPLQIAGWEKPRQRQRVDALMDMVGLNPDQRDRRPGALSGGQRQRVVIARALALSPRLIICDEPVSALDVSIQSQILNLLIRLQKELALAYLFIAHDLSVVRHIADRVAVMYLGSIVEEGPVEAVFSNPTHPYTEALLSAIPVPDPRIQRERRHILLEGDLPSQMDPPRGCAFAARCPLAVSQCRGARPEFSLVASDHKMRCFVRAEALPSDL